MIFDAATHVVWTVTFSCFDARSPLKLLGSLLPRSAHRRFPRCSEPEVLVNAVGWRILPKNLIGQSSSSSIKFLRMNAEDCVLSHFPHIWKYSPTITFRNMKRAVSLSWLRLIGQTLNEHSTVDAQIGKAASAAQIKNLDPVDNV